MQNFLRKIGILTLLVLAVTCEIVRAADSPCQVMQAKANYLMHTLLEPPQGTCLEDLEDVEAYGGKIKVSCRGIWYRYDVKAFYKLQGKPAIKLIHYSASFNARIEEFRTHVHITLLNTGDLSQFKLTHKPNPMYVCKDLVEWRMEQDGEVLKWSTLDPWEEECPCEEIRCSQYPHCMDYPDDEKEEVARPAGDTQDPTEYRK